MAWGPDAVAAVVPIQGGAAGWGARAAAPATPPAMADQFAKLIESQVLEVDASVRTAEVAMHDLAAGRAVELHDVMIKLEHARISVQTFVQVRNKLVESFQDLMRLQL